MAKDELVSLNPSARPWINNTLLLYLDPTVSSDLDFYALEFIMLLQCSRNLS